MTLNFEAFGITPHIGASVTVAAGGMLLQGVVTGHDTKDGSPVIEYEHDHVTLSGAIVKAKKWAWMHQIIDMSF